MATPVLTGIATLNPDVLVDDLVLDVIDGLREDLHPELGVRAYRVYRVVRTWSGAGAGEGSYVDSAAELRPQPLVWQWDGLRWVQLLCGLQDTGDVKLTEVSLTYTERQLTAGLDGADLAANQEAFLAIAEAHGQASITRLYTHQRPPYIDRIEDMGWVVWLHRIAGSSWQPT